MKKIILLFVIALSGILFFANPVFALNSELLVAPATGAKNITESFNLSVNINPQQNKICVVKGTINFDKLSCQSILVVSGIYSITTPTCENPNFILGIPGCTTAAKNILNLSVKGLQVGQGDVFFTNVKIISAGTILPFVSNSGTYNITENIVPVLATEEVLVAEVEEIAESENETPVEENPVVNQEVSENNNTQNPWAAGLLSVAQKYIWQILIVFILAIVAYAIYYFVSKTKK